MHAHTHCQLKLWWSHIPPAKGAMLALGTHYHRVPITTKAVRILQTVVNWRASKTRIDNCHFCSFPWASFPTPSPPSLNRGWNHCQCSNHIDHHQMFWNTWWNCFSENSCHVHISCTKVLICMFQCICTFMNTHVHVDMEYNFSQTSPRVNYCTSFQK